MRRELLGRRALEHDADSPAADDLDVEGVQLTCASMFLWCVTGLLAFCGIIACLQHIGRTRWEPLVWIMLTIHAPVIAGPLALVVIMLATRA
ncbi:MAG: hypothetical protein SYC29_10440 [Planctomycetota bacterium]|nr:hypothetical protein [Planctomycetota bacterium]